MSFDTKLLRYCDHKIVEEDHVVDDTDFKTVYLDSVVASDTDIVVRVNDTVWRKDNRIEIQREEDVTSQVDGSNSSFVVTNVPLYNGVNKSQVATKTDVVVQVTVIDEDVSAQFTGTDKLLVTQHRPLTSEYNVYATQLSSIDVIVKVNSVEVEISSIEPVFGKIVLKEAPLMGSTVTVTYLYKAHITAVNAQTGIITIKEKPQVGQLVAIYYYYAINDGWSIKTELNSSRLIFDTVKQTNQFLIVGEDVSDQFTGLEDRFYTENKPIIPPRAKMDTDPIRTLITQIVVKVNGIVVTPLNLNAEQGLVVLGFKPEKTDVVSVTYHCRKDGVAADLISISYQVNVNKCRKCKRTSQVNDYDYDKLGELITVVDEQKLLQDVLKFTIAVKGTNKANPWWGTILSSYVGTARSSEYYKPRFKSEVIDAGEKIKDLQIQQTQYQIVSDKEFFSHFEAMTVEQSDYDPNFYEINALVVSQAATAIEMNTSLLFNKPLLS